MNVLKSIIIITKLKKLHVRLIQRDPQKTDYNQSKPKKNLESMERRGFVVSRPAL